MNSRTGNRVILMSDPTINRRRTVTGLGGVKLVTEDSAGVARQVPDKVSATGDTNNANTSASKNNSKISIRENRRIATWNVRGLLEPGKIDIVEKEAEDHRLSILGITETHMRGQGHYNTPNGNTLYFSGSLDSSNSGVGFWVPRLLNSYVLGYNPVSERIMTIKLNTRPCTLHIVIVYAPTSTAKDEIMDKFYEELDDTLSKIPNREITIVLGDWNAKVGSTLNDDHIRSTVGKHGLGVRNDRGTRFLEFCIERKFTVMNTCFQHHNRRLYTWTSPGGRYRNQIDYILINSRWRTSITNVKTFPGADCGSDHCLLVADFALRLKAPRKSQSLKPRTLMPTERLRFQQLMDRALLEHPVPNVISTDAQWEHLKEKLWISADSITKSRTPNTSRQTWITSNTWNTIAERKQLKNQGLLSHDDKKKYSELNRRVQTYCRRDKNEFVQRICQEIENHAHKFQSADLFKKVRLLSKQFKPRSWVIEDADGSPLLDLKSITERWRKYCEDLYKGHDMTSPSGLTTWDDFPLEPPILQCEISAAVSSLKTKKAPGSDQITAELLKAMGSSGMRVLHQICNDVWCTGKWPNDWTKSIILPLHKKGSTAKCDNYRTLALISHASKVLLYVINNRIRHFLDWQIPQEQAGFVRGKGTREQIFNVRQLIEKSYEFNTPLIMCFIDYSKAFDCVVWNDLWKVLSELGVPRHLVALIQSLYYSNQGLVTIDGEFSDLFSFGKGVRQGCILSPILFNVYGEYIIRRTCEDWEGGVTIGGTKITNLRYADDTTLLASTEAEMATLLEKMERISNDMGLQINHAKTKLMVVDRACKLNLTGRLNLEVVDEFIYLGSNLSATGSCEKEIRRRIGMAKSAFSQLHKIWKDRSISRNTKVKLVNTLVFSIFHYGSETWTLKKADRDRIDAFEMWCWRKMLQIPWTAFRTNISILRELKVKTRLSSVCLRKVLEFFGHIARKDGGNLEQLIVTGKVDGKRSRGRSPLRWTDQIRSTMDVKIHDALHAAKDRSGWRDIVRSNILQGNHDAQP